MAVLSGQDVGPYTGEGADCLRDNLRRHSLQEKPGLGL